MKNILWWNIISLFIRLAKRVKESLFESYFFTSDRFLLSQGIEAFPVIRQLL